MADTERAVAIALCAWTVTGSMVGAYAKNYTKNQVQSAYNLAMANTMAQMILNGYAGHCPMTRRS